MYRIDRNKIEKLNSHIEAEWDGFVENATREERFLMVWELTKNAYIFEAAKKGLNEPEFLTKGFQRHIIAFEKI